MAKTRQMRGRITGRLEGKSGAWMTKKDDGGQGAQPDVGQPVREVDPVQEAPRGLDAEVLPAHQQKRREQRVVDEDQAKEERHALPGHGKRRRDNGAGTALEDEEARTVKNDAS